MLKKNVCQIFFYHVIFLHGRLEHYFLGINIVVKIRVPGIGEVGVLFLIRKNNKGALVNI